MAELLPDGTRRISLLQNQYARISAVLQRFVQKTKCSSVMLSYSSGLCVAKSGTMPDATTALLATLAAGNYSATMEMARLIGETSGFRVQFHEGTTANIYVAGIDDNFFLVVVFAKNITFGMVRVQTAKAIQELLPVVTEVAANVEEPENPNGAEAATDDEFRSELSSRLDAVLFSK